MSDLSDPPLALVPLPATVPWRWPTPPFAGYAGYAGDADGVIALAGAACEIEGLTSAALQATLLAFDLDAGCLRVRVQITGTEMDLRFAQMRRLTLLAPLVPQPPAAGDPHQGLLAHHPVSDYRLRLVGGAGTLSGRSIGHVESWQGLFLFPPQGDDGTVLRMFVPRSTYVHLDIGPRIGELLVAQAAVTPEQVEAAAAEQSHLRTRKLGELLVDERIVLPAQLMAAIDQQARMPVVRIGEALVALKLITEEQLAQALHKQKADRSVPLGELLVKAGHVSREDLQRALARKMGYPVVGSVQLRRLAAGRPSPSAWCGACALTAARHATRAVARSTSCCTTG